MTELHKQGFDTTKLPPELLDLILIERELGKRRLIEFVKLAWSQLEPGRIFIPNWHIEAICEHLEAVTAGEITRLLINVPPRCMKSLICSVFWPVWVWLNEPKHRWLTASYAQALATRDSVKSRRLIQSLWFQERWGDTFYLVGDQNAKERYENNATGYRIATAVDALGTGEGGDTQVIDDPHSIRQAESDAIREGTVTWLNETMSTRFMDPMLPRRVIIMQRTHPRDCSGNALEQGGYCHLCLPMRFEKVRMFLRLPDKTFNPDYVPPTPLGFEDPRVDDGELLWPERFKEGEIAKKLEGVEGEGLADLENRLGPYAVASQHQQRPTPRGGGMVKRDKLRIIDEVPEKVRLRCLRSWDYAATDPTKQDNYMDPDWTAGILMGLDDSDPDPDCYILDVVRFRLDPGERDDQVKLVAEQDGKGVSIEIEQEPGASGKSVIWRMRQLLVGYSVNPPRTEPMPNTPGMRKRSKESGVPTGNKVQRFETFATHAHRDKVYVLRGEWTAAYVTEVITFPLSAKADQVDATSQGFLRLFERPMGIAELMALKGFQA